MGEIFEAVHSFIGLVHLAPEILRFVRANPGLSGILAVVALAGVASAFFIGRVRPMTPPSIR